MDWRDRFPEAECIAAGDPYLAAIVKADDIIDDHLYNWQWLGLDELAAEAVAMEMEHIRTTYELRLLTRWWSL